MRYDPEVSVFAGLPDEPTPESWDALRTLVGPGGGAVLVRAVHNEPAGWSRLGGSVVLQMEATDELRPAVDHDVDDLDGRDLTAVLDLVARTQPGPFRDRTIELGDYVGVRAHGALVAMAGVRMRPPGHAELSAVCTDAAHRGHGHAARLSRAVAARMRERGETPFLHVLEDNVAAIRLYERIGFRIRRPLEVVALAAPR